MKQRYRRLMRLLGAGFLIALIAMTVFFVWAWYQATQIPDFYAAAMLVPPRQLSQSGEELERDIQRLGQDIHREGRWEVVVTEQQINGWLAVQLPRQHPGLLPRQLQLPRVDIDSARFRLAATYRGRRLESVVYVSLAIAAHNSDTSVAVTILEARAGSLPVPADSVRKYINQAADRVGIAIEWRKDDEDHLVAIVDVPLPQHARDLDIRIDQIVLQPEQVVVYGRSRHADSFLDWLNDSSQPLSESN